MHCFLLLFSFVFFCQALKYKGIAAGVDIDDEKKSEIGIQIEVYKYLNVCRIFIYLVAESETALWAGLCCQKIWLLPLRAKQTTKLKK